MNTPSSNPLTFSNGDFGYEITTAKGFVTTRHYKSTRLTFWSVRDNFKNVANGNNLEVGDVTHEDLRLLAERKAVLLK